MFLISKCRGDRDLGLCTTSVLAFGEPQRNGKIRFFLRRNTCFFAHRSRCQYVCIVYWIEVNLKFSRQPLSTAPAPGLGPKVNPQVTLKPKLKSLWHFQFFLASSALVSSSLAVQCVLLCFIKPILGNRYVRSQGFIMSEPRETHPQSEITDVLTSPCPPLDNLGCPDPHPPP